MIITIRQSGGYAGIEQELGCLDTADLDDAEATRIRACLDELSRLHEEQELPVGADLFRYEIEIRDDREAPQEIVFIQEGDPEKPWSEPLRVLLDVVGASP